MQSTPNVLTNNNVLEWVFTRNLEWGLLLEI
jgi:hypothetical protein